MSHGTEGLRLGPSKPNKSDLDCSDSKPFI